MKINKKWYEWIFHKRTWGFVFCAWGIATGDVEKVIAGVGMFSVGYVDNERKQPEPFKKEKAVLQKMKPKGK